MIHPFSPPLCTCLCLLVCPSFAHIDTPACSYAARLRLSPLVFLFSSFKTIVRWECGMLFSFLFFFVGNAHYSNNRMFKSTSDSLSQTQPTRALRCYLARHKTKVQANVDSLFSFLFFALIHFILTATPLLLLPPQTTSPTGLPNDQNLMLSRTHKKLDTRCVSLPQSSSRLQVCHVPCSCTPKSSNNDLLGSCPLFYCDPTLSLTRLRPFHLL